MENVLGTMSCAGPHPELDEGDPRTHSSACAGGGMDRRVESGDDIVPMGSMLEDAMTNDELGRALPKVMVDDQKEPSGDGDAPRYYVSVGE